MANGDDDIGDQARAKLIVEDDEEINSNKKRKMDDDSGSEEDNARVNRERNEMWEKEKKYFQQNKLIYELHETIQNQQDVFKKYVKTAQSERKDRIKELVTKRENYLAKILKIDKEIRRIQEYIDMSDKTSKKFES